MLHCLTKTKLVSARTLAVSSKISVNSESLLHRARRSPPVVRAKPNTRVEAQDTAAILTALQSGGQGAACDTTTNDRELEKPAVRRASLRQIPTAKLKSNVVCLWARVWQDVDNKYLSMK